VKGRGLAEIIEAQKLNSAKRMAAYVGQIHDVLIEGVSKRSEQNMYGRNTQNSVVIVPRFSGQSSNMELKPGDQIRVRIVSATAGSLKRRAQ
jgi:tRNA-2-methylthio-N6-dimethylallyladenosine synthase